MRYPWGYSGSRGRLRSAVVAHLLVAVLLGLPIACARSGPDRPNVVLVIIDTLRADRVGCYGAKTVDTPAIDALAREGVRFDSAVTPAPYTLPSIASILTGLYPYRHGVRTNEMDLSGGLTTMADLFQEAGYRTGAVVGSAVLTRERNLNQGFQFYDDQFPDSLRIFGKKYRDAGVSMGSRAQRRASDVTTRALEWIGRGGDPFFLMAHYFDPHTLYDPPPPYDALYADKPYEGEVAYTDEQVGRLIAGLAEAGYEKNTLVVLVADHGEGLGDHDEAGHGFFVYETTVRVPLIFRYPATLPAGRVVGELVRTTDVAATIAEIAGLPFSGAGDGRSLLPLIRGESLPSEPVYTEALRGFAAYGWSPLYGIRTERWKYVQAPTRELYDLPADPDEESNLFLENGPVADSLGSILRRHQDPESGFELRPAELANVTGEQRERLEALGYVSTGPSGRPSIDGDLPDPKEAIHDLNRRFEGQAAAAFAHRLIARGEHERAAEHLAEAIELNPKDEASTENLARIRMMAGEFEEAEALFRRLVDLDRENAQHRANLAGAMAGQGRIDEAITLLEECARIDPTNAEYRAALRSLRASAGK